MYVIFGRPAPPREEKGKLGYFGNFGIWMIPKLLSTPTKTVNKYACSMYCQASKQLQLLISQDVKTFYHVVGSAGYRDAYLVC